jgi:RNA polymerase sigma-70 factor, ECF subfamily
MKSDKFERQGAGLDLGISYDVIARAQRGSPEHTGMLYARYYQAIYRYLFYRTGDEQTAEDLTGEVFLKMVQALPAYRFETTPFQAWLFQVARNLAIDHYRRNSAHPVIEVNEDLDRDESDLESDTDIRLTSDCLAKALGQLEETQRDVIVLRFIEQMPIAAVALVLHKSEDAVKALQRRGLIALRRLLESTENGA